MNIYIVKGTEAESLLEQADFRVEWSRLCAQCPWATAFQGPDFGAIWYKIYRSRFEPLLVLSRAKDGLLNGLLPLAVSAKDGRLVIAGDHQAEYQVWVCSPDLRDVFAWQAVRSLKQDYPRAGLTFRYLPPGTPTDWLADDDASRTCKLGLHRRPLFRFGNGKEIEESLKKKSNRSRLNRLEKVGPLEFKRISDPKEFEDLFGRIIDCYDLRQAAAHGVAPFREDSLKKPFHVAMMNAPRLLHVTALKVGGPFAAVHLGACGNKEVHLGIIAHDPFLAKHSPGKFHVLFLAQMLMEEGYEQLDLTPGSDPYKDRFANAFDEVHTLTVFPSPGQRTREFLREGVRAAVKKSLKVFRVDPKHISSLTRKMKRIHPVRTPAVLIKSTREWFGRRREMRVYAYEAASVPDFEASELIHRDLLEDLLGYPPAEAWQSRQDFLSTALERMANGVHVYTCVENGRLIHYGWLIERQVTSFVSEVRREFTFPPDSAVLFDYYTFPQAQGRGLYMLSLRTMLRDAARIPGTEKIFILVLADNVPSRHVIEKVGFTYVCSLFEEVRFGRARRRTGTPETG